MPLPPIALAGQPDASGLYARIQLLEWLYYGQSSKVLAYLDAVGPARTYSFVPGPPDVVASYALAELPDQLVLLILGTETVAQLLSHVVGGSKPQLVTGGGFVNSFFWSVAEGMLPVVLAALADAPSATSIEIAGHSYGAAVAGLLSYLLINSGVTTPINLATYGSPRARGGPPPGTPPATWIRVRNTGDIVPVTPPSQATLASASLSSAPVWALSGAAPWTQDGLGYLLSPPNQGTTEYSDTLEDFATWKQPSPEWANAHYSPAYRMILGAIPGVTDPTGLLGGVPTPTPAQVDAGAMVPDQGPPSPSLARDANIVYYGTASGPVTPGNFGSLQMSSGQVNGAAVVPAANMEKGGDSVAAFAPSGYTKVTLCINNGTYGRQESHTCNIPVTSSSQLLQALTQLARARAALLGNYYTTLAASQKSLGSPQIEFAKCTDAFLPKIGQLFDMRGMNLFGPPGASLGQNASDTAFSSLTVRLQGTSFFGYIIPVTAIGNPENTTLQITENPDDCIEYGTPNLSFNMGNGSTWGSALINYVAALCSTTTGASWGFEGLNPSENKMSIAGWAVVGNTYGFTLTGGATPYNNGDRVVITGANNVFNKTWKLSFNAAGQNPTTYLLVNPPVSGHTVPGGGNAQRVYASAVQSPARLAGSTKAWYQYTGAQGGLTSPNVKVSKKSPGRQFLGVSFRTRRIRQR